MRFEFHISDFPETSSQKVLRDVGQIKLRFSSHMNTTESRNLVVKLEIVVKKQLWESKYFLLL